MYNIYYVIKYTCRWAERVTAMLEVDFTLFFFQTHNSVINTFSLPVVSKGDNANYIASTNQNPTG
jgi:hypothetical protein